MSTIKCKDHELCLRIERLEFKSQFLQPTKWNTIYFWTVCEWQMINNTVYIMSTTQNIYSVYIVSLLLISRSSTISQAWPIFTKQRALKLGSSLPQNQIILKPASLQLPYYFVFWLLYSQESPIFCLPLDLGQVTYMCRLLSMLQWFLPACILTVQVIDTVLTLSVLFHLLVL